MGEELKESRALFMICIPGVAQATQGLFPPTMDPIPSVLLGAVMLAGFLRAVESRSSSLPVLVLARLCRFKFVGFCV